MPLDFLFGERRPRLTPQTVEPLKAVRIEPIPSEASVGVPRPLRSGRVFFSTSPAAKCDWILSRYNLRLTQEIQSGSQRHTQLVRHLLKMASDPIKTQKLTLYFSGMDREFIKHIQNGDLSRDQERWADAEYNYWMALRLYPNHPGYIVQYAHTLKEQGKFADAALYYHEAIVLGEAPQNVKEHLYFTIGRAGLPSIDQNLISIERFWKGENGDRFDIPATQKHVVAMSELLMSRSPMSNSETYRWLARAPTLRDLICLMLKEPEFVNGHRQLLRLIAERLEQKQ